MMQRHFVMAPRCLQALALSALLLGTNACSSSESSADDNARELHNLEPDVTTQARRFASSDAVVVEPGTNTISIATLLSNDDPNVDTATFVADVTTTRGLSLTSDGTNLTYVLSSNPGWSWDSFSYQVCETGGGDCDHATVQLIPQGTDAGSCGTLAIQESFRGDSHDPRWSFLSNDPAYPVFLTADATAGPPGHVPDPMDDGWLRLSPPENSKSGAAFFDVPFPSTAGVSISFEAASWGGKDRGGDGMVFFLVDGSKVNASNFALGAPKGSLSYASGKSLGGANIGGMPHAVTGVAFDHWGGFGNGQENRVGPVDNPTSDLSKPNSVTVRGDAASHWQTLYWEAVPTSILEMSCPTAEGCLTRPTSLGAGRYRATIVITPSNDNTKFHLRVFVKSSDVGNFELVADTDIPQTLLPTLKLGFIGASGGGLSANHEIRDLSVSSLVDAKLDLSVTPEPLVNGEAATYTFTATNNTNLPICAAAVDLQLPDGFEIESQQCVATPNSSCGLLGQTGVTEDIIALDGSGVVTITIVGTARDSGDGTPGTASGTVTPGAGQGDENPGDNTSTSNTEYQFDSNLGASGTDLWVAVGSGPASTTVQNSQPGAIESVTVSTGAGTVVIDPADPNGFIFSPTDDSVPTTYVVSVKSCATAVPTNCATTPISIHYNDAPEIAGGITDVYTGNSANLPLTTSFGVMDGDIQPPTIVRSQGVGTCTISGNTVVYAAAIHDAVGQTASCTVTVCEAKPVGLCSSAHFNFNILAGLVPFTPANDTISTTEETPVDVTIDYLLSNDGGADKDSFELVGTPDAQGVILTAKGGTLEKNSGDENYVYTPPEGFIGTDTFEYTICSAYDAQDCSTVEVVITVNKAPAATDRTIWVVTGTPDVQVDPSENYVGEPIASVTVVSVGPPDGDGNAPGVVSVNADHTITFVPADPAIPGSFDVVLQVCDNATPQACAPLTVTIIYNDPPVTADADIEVPSDKTTTISFPDLINTSTPGEVDGGWDESSIQVSNSATGPFGDDADLGGNFGCSIENGALSYTAASADEGDATPSCFVQVCELNPGPAGTDSTERACGVVEVKPTINNNLPPVVVADVVITGPADQTETTDTTPTVTGTGEPNTEVTIEVDGKIVGKVPVDANGVWSWTPSEDLEKGKHAITAKGSNGSTDSITLTILDETGPDPDLDNLSVSGGRVFGACSSANPSAPATTLWVLCMGIALARLRRRYTHR